MSFFQDNFWGEDNRGFSVLLQRLKLGRRTTEALLEFISTRIEIEEEYNRKLQKLAAFTFPREEHFFCKKATSNGNSAGGPSGAQEAFDLYGALMALPAQTADLCSRHGTLIDSLKQRLLWPLEHNLKEQATLKEQHKTEMLRLIKTRANQADMVERLRDRYYTRCKEKSILIDADVISLTGKALDKHEQKLRKAKEAEQQADSEYRSSAYKLAELHTQWLSRMRLSLSEFAKSEETRLVLTRHCLLEYGAISHLHMAEQATAYERLRERAAQCDHKRELETFVARHGTGSAVPRMPAYAASSETLEESLRRLSIRSTLSPRKLYTGAEPVESILGRRPLSPASSLVSNGDATIGTGKGGSGNRSSVSSLASTGSSLSFSRTSNSNFPLPTMSLFTARALYGYEAQQGDELSLREGELVKVLSTVEDPWWMGQIDGAIGLFPSNYVERL